MPPSLRSPSPPLSSSPPLSPDLSSSRISLSPITATRVRCRPSSLSAGHRSSPLAARRYHSSPAPRRSLRLAAQAQAHANRFGLTGLIILPIPTSRASRPPYPDTPKSAATSSSRERQPRRPSSTTTPRPLTSTLLTNVTVATPAASLSLATRAVFSTSECRCRFTR